MVESFPWRSQQQLWIITLDQEDSLTEDRQQIRSVPAWKWLD
jgi:hypothetical protein